jgi:sulfur carrier protein ThiS
VKVRVSLFGNLALYMPEGSNGFSFTFSMDEGATVQELLGRLRLPPDLPLVIAINGKQADTGRILNDGDDIHILRVAGGG